MSPVNSDRVRELREKAGLSQRDMARLTGIRQPTISDVENGKAPGLTVANLEAIATALDCEPGDLLKSVRKRGK